MEQEYISASLQRIEDELNLLSLEIDSVTVWEYIRHRVQRKLNIEKGIIDHPHDKQTAGKLATGYKILRNLAIRNPFLAPTTDVLVWGHSRRKKLEDGRWWDLYCDPILSEMDRDYVYIEDPHWDQHHTPAKTANVYYLDLLYYTGDIRDFIGQYNVSISQEEQRRLDRINNRFTESFDVDLDITEMVVDALTKRASQLPFYKALLRRLDPNLVILVVSYGKEAFIEACNALDIPVIELQHGVIHSKKLEYAYPNKTTFPDYLFVWGEFWKNIIEFPIDRDNIIPVGYPYLEKRYQEFKDCERKDQILFISQGNIGEQLSQFAVEVSQHPQVSSDIVYKLHPGEYERWQDEYPWLVDSDLTIIDSSEPPLYKLFAESNVQIGVGSTAVYEGLCFELETYVCDYPKSSVLKPLVEEGTAELISSVDELVSSLGTKKGAFDREYYFEPNANDNIFRALQQFN